MPRSSSRERTPTFRAGAVHFIRRLGKIKRGRYRDRPNLLTMDNNFLPTDYEAPKSEEKYFKFKEGDNRFRVLSSAIVGYEYWTLEKKPVRSKSMWEEKPANAKVNENGSFQKFFWAFIVWNYDLGKVQIMQITQKTIQEGLEALVLNKKWGDPKKYDIVIKAEGEKLDRTYQVIPEPHSDAPEADISQIKLTALYDGADPFGQN